MSQSRYNWKNSGYKKTKMGFSIPDKQPSIFKLDFLSFIDHMTHIGDEHITLTLPKVIFKNI